MYKFESAAEVGVFIRDAIKASMYEHTIVGAYQNRCRLYDMGTQWISAHLTEAQTVKLDRQLTNYVGEKAPIRVTANRITKHIRGVAAATKPRLLEFDATPDSTAPGPGEFHAAKIVELAGNAMSAMSNFMAAAQCANNERTVAGMHGVGLAIENPRVTIDGAEMSDARIRAFDFDVTRLSLDPFNRSSDLRDHDYVIYTDVWTVHKIRREFGPDALAGVDEKQMQTVGQLMPIEMRFHTLSGGSMYSQYAMHSKTKGARIHLLYCRHPSGRFDRLYRGIETPNRPGEKGEPVRVLNFENPENPWGASGMPMVLLMGHFRAGTRNAVSDVGMMIDDQDKLNLLASVWFQGLYDYNNPQWIVDQRWFGPKMDMQQIDQMLRQRVIAGDYGHNEAYKFRPTLEKPPTPDMNIEALTRAYAEDIREQSFRTEQDVGRLKSHVTTSQLVTTNELSRQVLDDRVADDIARYEQLGQVAASTGIRQALMGRPTIIASLRRAGFGMDEFIAVQSMNPDEPGATIKMRSSSLRHRSRDQRKQDLDVAVQLQVVDPITYRRSLASELGVPMSDLDAEVVDYCKRQSRRVMAGEPLALVSLGPIYGQMLIDELTRAMVSRQAEQTPGAIENLTMAIEEVTLMIAPPPEVQGGGGSGGTPSGGAAGGEFQDDESVALAQLAAAFDRG